MAECQAENACENGPSTTVVVEETEDINASVPSMRLKLRKPKGKKKVVWSPETVDNENMNKKKSKCCCIYQKPHEFGESSSEDDNDECDHCQGHVERKSKRQQNAPLDEKHPVVPTDSGENK